MRIKNSLLVILLIFNLSTFSQINQINQSQVSYYSAQVKERIYNYYSALNLISGDKLENEEKGTIIYETINNMFESEQVYVFNDVDPTGTTQTDFKIKDCLENIRLFYSNSDVSFVIDSLKLSDIYKAKSFFFFKVEVFRKMIVTFNNQQKKDSKDLDFYIKFLPGFFDCQIYSIKQHEENLNQFEKAKIIMVDKYEQEKKQREEQVKIQKQFRDTIVGFDSLKILQNEINNIKSEIKKHSNKQTFFLVSTLVSAGAGGYFLYGSNQKYNEYLNSANSRAADLRKTVDLYDKLGPVFLGLAGACAIEFTIQTIKKGKSNKKLKLYTKGNGLALSYKF